MPYFDPYKAYRVLSEHWIITAQTLQSFLAVNGYKATVEDMKPLISEFSMKRLTKKLDFNEFCSIVLPATNVVLRARVTCLNDD